MDIVNAKTILLTKVKGAKLAKEEQEVIVKGTLAAAIASEKIAVDAETLSVVKNKVATMVLNGAKKEEIISFLASTLNISADTAAKIANKIATDSLKTSIMGLLGPIGLVIAAVTAAIAIFTAWKKSEEEKEE
jgi:hypothetical protein